MLGSRTKQVYAYGRRNQRIVNVSENPSQLDPLKQSSDASPAPRKPTSRAVTKPKASSPKAALAMKRKKLSPGRPLPVKRLVDLDFTEPSSPLSSRRSNAPGSPAVPIRNRPKTPAAKLGGLKAAFTPFIDVDIQVRDEDGKVLQREKRVAKAAPKSSARVRSQTQPRIISLIGDDESPAQSPSQSPQQHRRPITARRSAKDRPSSPTPHFEEEGEALAQPKPSRLLPQRTRVVQSDDEASRSSESDSSSSILVSRNIRKHNTFRTEDRQRYGARPAARCAHTKATIHKAESASSAPEEVSEDDDLPEQHPCYGTQNASSKEKPYQANSTTGRASGCIRIEGRPSESAGLKTKRNSSTRRGDTDGLPTLNITALSSRHPPTLDEQDQPSSTEVLPHHDLYRPIPALMKAKPLAYVDSPALKARPLTPIRRSGHRLNTSSLFPRPPSPPSPTTPTDIDLSCDFSSLDLSTDLPPHYTPPPYLAALLEECAQSDTGPYEFSAFIDTFPYDPVVNSDHGGERLRAEFRKIGEASYSEVFGIGDVVLKIVPLRNEDAVGPVLDVEGPAPSDAPDVLREIAVTRAMGDMCPSFVKLLKTYVVKGRYPELLLGLWDEFESANGSESIRPDTFALSQTYAIIVLPNGGPDLETYAFSNSAKFGWKYAASIFWQTAKALSKAEELVQFEHRDLHWGQILIRNTSACQGLPVLQPRKNTNVTAASAVEEVQNKFMDDVSNGVSVTIIDLGLSRMDAGDGVSGRKTIWTAFDEEIFLGEGDYQFDVYRLMKTHNEDSWQTFKPLTNVMWLHYLLLKLIKSKGLKAPRKSGTQPANNGKAQTERMCYDALMEMEKLIGRSVASVFATKAPTKARAKTTAKGAAKAGVPVVDCPISAIEVVAYGVKRQWVALAC